MNKIETVEAVVAETNAVVPVSDSIRSVLVRDLAPVAERLARYEEAALMPVVNRQDAEQAAQVCEEIAVDIKAVKGHEVLSKITSGLHQLHIRWTGLVGDFVTPMEAGKRKIKKHTRGK